MRSEEFLRFSGGIPEPYLLVSEEGSVLAANPEAARLLGIETGGGGATLPLLVSDPAGRVTNYLRTCARSGSMLPGAITLRTDDSGGMRMRCQGCAVRIASRDEPALVLLRLEPRSRAVDHFRVLNRTIDDLTREGHRRRRTEEALRRSERRAAFLADASRILTESLDPEETLQAVARLAVPTFADWCALGLLTESGRVRTVAAQHREHGKLDLVRRLHEHEASRSGAERGVAAVLRTARSDYALEVRDGTLEELAQDDEHLELLSELRPCSYVIAPMATPERTRGAVTFAYGESGRSYQDADVRMVEDLARRAAVAIEKAELVRDAELVREKIEQRNRELLLANERLAEAHDQAEEARREAENASRAKSEFLSVMSHELRTPLNAIVGYVDLLEAGIGGNLSPEQRRHLGRVRRSTQHLVFLVDQVLSLTRIEVGAEEIVAELVDVGELVREASGLVEALVVREGLDLRAVVPDDPVLVKTDAGKVRQILLNLLSNAVKFTREGFIEVRVERDEDDVLVKVEDTGVGIEASDLDRIFDPFTQVDPTTTRRVGGTGLGLPVSRELAHLLSGEITVESTPGRGSVFTLRLPSAVPAGRTEGPGRR